MKNYVLIRRGREDAALACVAAAPPPGYDVAVEYSGDQLMLVITNAGPLGVSASAQACFNALWSADCLAPIGWPDDIPLRHADNDDPFWNALPLIGSM